MQQQGFNLKVEEVGLLVSRKNHTWEQVWTGLWQTWTRTVSGVWKLNLPLVKLEWMSTKPANQNLLFGKNVWWNHKVKKKPWLLYSSPRSTILFKSRPERNYFCSLLWWRQASIYTVIENIFFDGSCWQEYLPKIDYFFKRAFFPEMLNRRVQRGKLLYIHGGWIPYGNYSCTSNGLKLTLQRAHWH